MNEIKIKQIEFEIQNLTSLRSNFNAIIIVLTGGIVGLFYNLNTLNIILLILGAIFDYIFFLKSYQITKKIYSLIKGVNKLCK